MLMIFINNDVIGVVNIDIFIGKFVCCSKIHILGSFKNIRIARNAICSLILGKWWMRNVRYTMCMCVFMCVYIFVCICVFVYVYMFVCAMCVCMLNYNVCERKRK